LLSKEDQDMPEVSWSKKGF